MSQATFKRLAYQFQMSGQEIPVIVYDVDDILWNFIGYIAIRHHLDPHLCSAIFRTRENWLLTKDEQERVFQAFSDVNTFRDIKFYPGTTDILRPEELGARVKINSNSVSAEVGALKVEQLLQAIPNLKPENIQINVLDYTNSDKKPLDEQTTILIEDSPYNVRGSSALINLMPNNPLWTHTVQSKLLIQHKPVIWLPDLIAINNFVYTAVKHMMGPSYVLG